MRGGGETTSEKFFFQIGKKERNALLEGEAPVRLDKKRGDKENQPSETLER